MIGLNHPCQKRALIPLKFEVIFNYDTFFKVAQSYPYGPKLAQLTVHVFTNETAVKSTCEYLWLAAQLRQARLQRLHLLLGPLQLVLAALTRALERV